MFLISLSQPCFRYGIFAIVDKIQFFSRFSKTHSGKIMHRILRKITKNDDDN
ncbi:hypothetical protein [uncultured Gammaproteobacteria bacterium]|nr:hypothetical protein [uncultured Gammaproteobacteria bacterium]